MKKLILFVFLLLNVACFWAKDDKVEKPQLTDQESFSMILLPDPQSYTKFDVNQPIFELMTAWISSQIKPLNIKAVLCTGDLVEQNAYLVPDNKNGNQTSTQQWTAASRAFSRLDNKVPYIICGGNHDYGYVRAENRLSELPKYFPVERNSTWKDCLVSVCNNAFGIPTLENAAYEFSDQNWGKILVVAVEFAPRDEVLTWISDLAKQDRFKEHKIFILTHSYLTWEGKRIEKESYKVSPANYGQAIWDKVIYPADNIRMLVCGHYSSIDGFRYNVGQRNDKNHIGRNVFQMMFNAQTEGGRGWLDNNGGDGWLRIMEFMPDGKTIKIKTYSPFFGISPTTEKYSWRKDSWDEFSIVLE